MTSDPTLEGLLRLMDATPGPICDRCEATLEGYNVTMSDELHHGRAVTHYATFTFRHRRPLAHAFRVSPEGVGDRLMVSLGGQDLQTGDPAFDPAFRVQSKSPEATLALLGAEVRAHLLACGQEAQVVELTAQHLRLELPEVLKDHDREHLRRVLRSGLEVLKSLEERAPETLPTPHVTLDAPRTRHDPRGALMFLNAAIGLFAFLGVFLMILWVRDAQIHPLAAAGALWGGQVALGLLPVLLYGRSRRADAAILPPPLASAAPTGEDAPQAAARAKQVEVVEVVEVVKE